MPKNGNLYSVNCCNHCKRNLTLSEDAHKSPFRTLCSDCTYFENIGVYTIEQYNNWLKGEHKR